MHMRIRHYFAVLYFITRRYHDRLSWHRCGICDMHLCAMHLLITINWPTILLPTPTLPHHYQRDVHFRLTVYCVLCIGSGKTSISRNSVSLVMPSGPMTRCHKIQVAINRITDTQGHAFCRKARNTEYGVHLDWSSMSSYSCFASLAVWHVFYHHICSD